MMQPHAVACTGAEVTQLAGGRSRRTANGVPVLELSDHTYSLVASAVDQLHDMEQETEYLVGVRAYLHAPHGRVGGPDLASVTIGGETLDEAAKSCVVYFEDYVSDGAPDWVASTNAHLAEVLADHYNCAVRSLDEELAP